MGSGCPQLLRAIGSLSRPTRMAGPVSDEKGDAITVECRGLGHRFGSQRLFADLSFAAQRSQSVCIAGANGSGKSTLLRIVAGLLEPVAGTVRWTAGDRELTRQEVRSHLGYVSPDVHLYGELTLLENLQLFARLRHLADDSTRLEKLLAAFDLEDHAGKRLQLLSSGQKQRARYLVATLHEPAVLILDEPSANLDARGRSLVSSLMARQKASRVLMVATNEEEEYGFGDRLVLLGD